MACYILQVGAGARVNDSNVKYKRHILASGVVVKECPTFVMSIHRGFNRPFCLLVLSRKGHVSSNDKLELALTKGSSHCLVEHSIVGKRAPSRSCAGCSVEAGDFLPATIAMTHPTKKSRHVMRSQTSAYGLPPHGSSIVSSYETPSHSTNVIAPFFRTPQNLTVALFTVVLSIFWRSCRSVFPRCAWRACESVDGTQSTTPTHTPRMLRLVWFNPFSLSGWVPNGSSHCSRCSTPAPSRYLPPAPLLPLTPTSTSKVPILPLEGPLPAPGCPRTTHCILYLASRHFGGYNLQLFKER